MFKDSYAALHSHIKPHEALIDATIDIAARKRLPFKRRLCKPILVEVAVCVLILISIPVLVATVDPIYDMVYSISPSIAQFFRPIKRHAVDQGIKIEIEKAYRTNSAVKMYATIQDLTGDRIDETLRFTYGIDAYAPEKYGVSSQVINYDKETKTATVVFTLVYEDDAQTSWSSGSSEKRAASMLSSDKLTVNIKRFTSKGVSYGDYKLPVDLSTVPVATETRQANEEETHYRSGSVWPDHEDIGTVLVPSEPEKRVPVEKVYFVDAAYVNNRLHVLIANDYIEYESNYGESYLMDDDGSREYGSYVVNMSDSLIKVGDKYEGAQYREAVFDIPQSEIGKYKLYINFNTSGPVTEGDWTVTVPVQDTRKQKTALSSAE